MTQFNAEHRSRDLNRGNKAEGVPLDAQADAFPPVAKRLSASIATKIKPNQMAPSL
jgi:hypothetical protein